MPSLDFSPLKALLDRLIDRGVPGCEVIVSRRHETLYRYRAGWRDREAGLPLRGDEMYQMYSVSKPVTVTAALQLLEKGLYLVTDPVSDYLPEFKDLSVRGADGALRPLSRPMTVLNLFNMTAGFDYDLQAEPIRRALQEKGDACSTRDIVRALAQRPLSFDPGEHWQYSLCHDVLAALVEVVSGQRFSDYVRDHIFKPLGMTRSRYHRAPGDETAFAALYRFNDETGHATREPLDCRYIFTPLYDSGGAGVLSCVDDYARFADALACSGVGATGARVLSRASVDLMRENTLSPAALQDFNWSQLAGYGYGLGVRTLISRAEGGALSPLGEFGWGGAAGAYLMIDPSHEVSVFYAQHMLNNMEPYIHPRIRNTVYGILSAEAD